MLPNPRFTPSVSFAASLLAVAFFIAGCASDRPRGENRPLPPPLAGQAMFFAGKLLAQINVGGSARAEALAASGATETVDESSESRRRPHGGGGMRSGGRREGGRSDAAGERSPRPRFGAMGPLVMIHLRFTNQGDAPLEVRISDFISPLGNFAVQPEKLTLAPGQTLETEPMSAPVGSPLEEIEAQLVLRVGDQTEKQIVRLLPVAPPAS